MKRTLGAAALAACLGCGADPARPPSLRLGEEVCDRCRMIISDERFVAAIVDPDGVARKFDDVGCLIKGEQERAPAPGARHWVRDFGGSGWLDARAAMFERSGEVESPMGFGWKAAPAPATDEGSGLRFDQLPAALAGRSDGVGVGVDHDE